MTRLLLALLLLAAVALVVARLRAARTAAPVAPADDEPLDPDDATLRALADAGADLSLPTETRFFLYFPTAQHAESAAVVARREGWAAEVSAPVEGYTQWLCLLTREMVPSREAITSARARLEELAESLSGEFDGWEAAVAS